MGGSQRTLREPKNRKAPAGVLSQDSFCCEVPALTTATPTTPYSLYFRDEIEFFEAKNTITALSYTFLHTESILLAHELLPCYLSLCISVQICNVVTGKHNCYLSVSNRPILTQTPVIPKGFCNMSIYFIQHNNLILQAKMLLGSCVDLPYLCVIYTDIT